MASERKPLKRPGQALAQQPYQHLLHDGERFFKAKDYATAFAIYQRALSLAPPGDQRALGQLCRCYRKKALKALKRDDFKEVQALLQEMLSLPGYQSLAKGLDYKILAEVQFELGEFEACEQALEHALALEPDLASELASLQRRLKTEQLARQMKGLH